MSDFHEVRFPTEIALGATGGPERRTQIVTLASGHEERNQQWAHSRRRYDAGYGIKTLDDIHAIIAFFEERRGRLHGFRWRDPFDHKSSVPSDPPLALNQVQPIADGETTFQLTKTYGAGSSAYFRAIAKPVAGTVLVAEDGVALTETIDFTVDTTTGVVSRVTGTWSDAAPVTAGFEFDVPVRFDTDRLDIDLAAFEAGVIPNIPIVELRL